MKESRPSHRTVWLLALCVAATLTLAASAQPQPPVEEVPLSVTFDASSLRIEGASPSGLVATFGVGRDRVGYTARTLRFDEVVTADETGSARFDLPASASNGASDGTSNDGSTNDANAAAVPSRSVWAVVDLATGAYVLAAPEGTELRRIDGPARGLGAAARFVEQDGRLLDLLLVRPESSPEGAEAAGLWGLRVGDGGDGDDDGATDARISLRFAELWPLADSPPAPETLAPKDVLIGVDPESLEIYAVQLAAPPADGEVK